MANFIVYKTAKVDPNYIAWEGSASSEKDAIQKAFSSGKITEAHIKKFEQGMLKVVQKQGEKSGVDWRHGDDIDAFSKASKMNNDMDLKEMDINELKKHYKDLEAMPVKSAGVSKMLRELRQELEARNKEQNVNLGGFSDKKLMQLYSALILRDHIDDERPRRLMELVKKEAAKRGIKQLKSNAKGEKQFKNTIVYSVYLPNGKTNEFRFDVITPKKMTQSEAKVALTEHAKENVLPNTKYELVKVMSYETVAKTNAMDNEKTMFAQGDYKGVKYKIVRFDDKNSPSKYIFMGIIGAKEINTDEEYTEKEVREAIKKQIDSMTKGNSKGENMDATQKKIAILKSNAPAKVKLNAVKKLDNACKNEELKNKIINSNASDNVKQAALKRLG